MCNDPIKFFIKEFLFIISDLKKLKWTFKNIKFIYLFLK